MTNQNNSLVFVYGSLRRYESNHVLLMDATPVSLQARTQGILLDTGFGYPAAAEGVEWIYGELYSVNPVQLQQLDLLEGYYGEGYINHYDRVQQTVFTDNGAHGAWMYRYSNEQAEGLESVPFGDWKLHRRRFNTTLNYFAYGSMMDSKRLIEDDADHLFQNVLGRGVVSGHVLRFTLNRCDGGRADILEGVGTLEGKVYRINRVALDYLYGREGVFSRIYRPTFVDVEVNGHVIQDVLTFKVVNKGAEMAPPTWYVDEIVRGGQGTLSDEYLKDVVSRLKSKFGLHFGMNLNDGFSVQDRKESV